MDLIKESKIDFIDKSRLTILLSCFLILCGIVSLIIKGGPALGIDFSGGILIQLNFSQPISISEIRSSLKKLDLGDSEIQEFGSPNDIIVKAPSSPEELEDIGSKVKNVLLEGNKNVVITVERTEIVGPKVGKDLRQKALFALYYSILFITVYISGRFELKWASSIAMALLLLFIMNLSTTFFPALSISILIFIALAVTLIFCFLLDLKYGIGAIVALIHDVIITVGVFSLTGKEFNLPVIAAFLTIIGYSLNDTIVVFDRIRENTRSYSGAKIETIKGLINKSINQTMSRTLLTSLTTLLVVAVLFIFGGEVIHDFAFALLIGIIVGTYSSIFIASPILIIWETKIRAFIPVYAHGKAK